MREEETFRDAVGIIVVVDVFVVAAVFARPHQDRVLKGSGAEDERKQTHGPGRLKGNVREEPVITQADAEPARQEHGEEKRDLEPVEAEMPEVEWNGGERDGERADEKRAGRPINAVKWETRHI